MTYRDKITIRYQDFAPGTFREVVEQARETITGYGEVVDERTIGSGVNERVEIKFTLEARDLWDLHEKAADLADSLRAWSHHSFSPSKRKVVK
jgi:hypothetical protein